MFVSVLKLKGSEYLSTSNTIDHSFLLLSAIIYELRMMLIIPTMTLKLKNSDANGKYVS